MKRIEIRLLGEFRVAVGEHMLPPTAWEHRRAADLVKLLALSTGHCRPRDQVLETLCPNLDADAAAAALHKAASIARRVLGEPQAVVLRGGDVMLAPDGVVDTDVARFEDAARNALAANDAQACARAATLYSGELLPSDRYADWVSPHRERLAARYLELLRKAGAWEQVVQHEPLDEGAHMALMRLYASVGDRTAALRQFRTLRKLLAEELGVTPSAEVVRLYEEIARGPAVHAPVASSEAIEGRQVELARARALLRKVATGRGHTLLVRGDGGIGKTRLCEALLVEAVTDGATTLRGTARMDGPGSYAPVVEAVDRLLLERPDLAAALTEPARQVLACLGAGIGAAVESRAPIARQRILMSVTQLFTIAAKERPVVVFFDDLHEADESTLELVHYLSEHARFHKILVLLAFRHEHGPSLGRVRGALLAQRAATEIELRGLSRAETAQLVARCTGNQPPSMMLDAIYERAEGNPLFTEMLAATVGSADHLEIPEDLFLVLDGFLARAGEPAVALLERASVLGATFTAEEILALAGAGEAEAFARLDSALAARVIEEAFGGYRFRHGLLRETLLRRLPSHRLREAHRAAARALADTNAPAGRVAQQLLKAGAPAEAAPWFAQAARHEASVAAYRSALTFLDLALEHGPASQELLCLRADLLMATAEQTAPAAYSEAMLHADPAQRSALAVSKARAHAALGQFELAVQELADVEPPVDRTERMRYCVTRAMVDWIRGDLDAAERAASEARALATEPDQAAELVEAVVMSGLIAHTRGSFTEHVRMDLLNDEQLAHARGSPLATAIQDGHVCVSEGWLYGSEPYANIARFAREMRDAASKTGARRAVAFASCVLGETELLTGDLPAAEEHLAHAASVSLEVRSLCTAALATQRQAEVALAAGQRDTAHALLDRALEIARESPLGQRHILQRIYGARITAAASVDEALATVDEAELAIVGPAEGCTACMITLAVPAAIACARAGDLDRARRHLDVATHLAHMFWQGGAWHAAVDEAQGVLHAQEGRQAEAREHFERARTTFAAIGQPLDAERCERAANS